jgi:hypothetical protein
LIDRFLSGVISISAIVIFVCESTFVICRRWYAKLCFILAHYLRL